MLALLHQKGALSHKQSFGSSSYPLSFGVPRDKFPANSSNKLLHMKDLDLKSLHNTTAEELMDSSNLCLDSCVTGGLRGFKSDFIDGLHATVTEHHQTPQHVNL